MKSSDEVINALCGLGISNEPSEETFNGCKELICNMLSPKKKNNLNMHQLCDGIFFEELMLGKVPINYLHLGALSTRLLDKLIILVIHGNKHVNKVLYALN